MAAASQPRLVQATLFTFIDGPTKRHLPFTSSTSTRTTSGMWCLTQSDTEAVLASAFASQRGFFRNAGLSGAATLFLKC